MRFLVGMISLISLFFLVSPLYAQAPRGNGRSARGVSAVQRALESRRRGLQRAVQRQGGSVGNRTTGSANGIGSNSAAISPARRRGGNRPGNAFRESILRRVGPQTGTGRLGNPALRGRVNRSRGFAERRRGTSRRSDVLRRLRSRDNPGRRISAEALERTRGDRRVFGRERTGRGTDDEPARRRFDDVTSRRNGPPRSIAEGILAKRLAEIDRLRDIALKNDNVRLLEQADKLEQLARQQYQLHVEGTKLDAPSNFRRINPEADSGNGTTQSIDARRALDDNETPIPADRFTSP